MISRLRAPVRFIGARPVITAIAGALTIAFSGIIVRLSHAEPATAATFRCLYAVPFLIPLAVLERRRAPGRSRRSSLLGAAAGVLFTVDLLAWHYAIRDIGAGLSTTLANAQAVVIAIVAWLVLRERVQRTTVAALPVVAVGVLLISGLLEHGAYGADPHQGAFLGIVTAVSYASFILLMRAATESARRPVAPLLEATAVAAVASAIGGELLGAIDLVPSWPSAGWLLLLATTSQVLGWLLIGVSLPRLPAAVGAILLTIQPVGSVILGRLLVDEHPSLLQLVGVGLLVCGVVIAVAGAQVSARWRAPGAVEA